MDPLRLHAKDIADRCTRETGARRISRYANEVALIALWLTDVPPQDNIQRRIRDTFKERHPERGSIFIMIVLPILVSVISQWIVEWLKNRDVTAIRNQAKTMLSA